MKMAGIKLRLCAVGFSLAVPEGRHRASVELAISSGLAKREDRRQTIDAHKGMSLASAAAISAT